MDIYYQNVRGLNTKLNEVLNGSFITNYDIIALTETWLNESVSNSELFCDKYFVYRKDRDFDRVGKIRGGGVLCAINCKFKSSVIDINLNSSCNSDIICIKVQLTSTYNIYIVVVYTPPPVSMHQYNLIFECLECLPPILENDFILLGDLNISKLSDFYNNGYSNNIIRGFDYFYKILNANQYNNIRNSEGGILDVVLSNVKCNISHDNCSLVPEDNYHPSLHILPSISSVPGHSTYSSYNNNVYHNFRFSNFQLLYELVYNTNWNVLEQYSEVDSAFNQFYEILYNIYNTCVPRTKMTKSKYPPWFTKAIIGDIKAKEKSHKLYKKINLESWRHGFTKRS